MMKKYILLLFTLILSLPLLAQLEVKEGSFKEVPGFVNINTDKMYDDNDKPYAVLKIKTENISSKERHELNFKGDAQTFFEVEYKDGEVWLYISYYATYIKISHEEFSSTEFHFPYDMKPKCGYELTLVNKTSKHGPGSGSLTITTTPENGATISLNGKILNQTTPYSNDMIASGKYEIVVSKDKFKTTKQNINLLDGENKTIEIEMSYAYGKLSVESEPSGATVYIDGINYGITPAEINEIIIGTHVIKLRKTNYVSNTKTIVLNEDDELLIREQLIHSSTDGTINGIFSIDSSRTVKFSKGNLQYNASTNTWRFAEYQWEYIGESNKNISSIYNDWIDLFGWGTGNNPTLSSKLYEDYKTFFDWGNNTISNGLYEHWMTLSSDEWHYLLYERETKSGIRYAKANVNGVNGVIILPDNWKKIFYRLNKTNNYYTSFNTNLIMLYDWKNRLEANGAVFLPAAGRRYGVSVEEVGTDGYYWSSSFYHDQYSQDIIIGNKSFGTNYNYSCGGRSVRLVCPTDDD